MKQQITVLFNLIFSTKLIKYRQTSSKTIDISFFTHHGTIPIDYRLTMTIFQNDLNVNVHVT